MFEMVLSEIVEKATVANVVGAIVVVAVTGAGIYYQQWEVLGVIVGAAIAYLFPKQTG